MLKVVLDTNVVLRSVSRRSPFGVIIDKLYDGSYELWITNDIVLEYEEKITDIFSKETADLFIGSLLLLPNVKKTDLHFKFELISHDQDNNKFIDCAFAANAHYLVTNDNHFNSLKSIEFPAINTITLEAFFEAIIL